MADKLSYDVGKKIVDALKMQGDASSSNDFKNIDMKDSDFSFDSDFNDAEGSYSTEFEESSSKGESNSSVSSLTQSDYFQNSFNSSNISSNSLSVDAAFAQSVANNLGVEPISANIDLPSNVAVLNSLIAKLPVGVSKQTGALIIKQTMEALGISMPTVLQEARQVQESLISGARECQKNILDCKNQINSLEQKARMYQNQAVAMNDVISLFSNVSI